MRSQSDCSETVAGPGAHGAAGVHLQGRGRRPKGPRVSRLDDPQVVRFTSVERGTTDRRWVRILEVRESSLTSSVRREFAASPPSANVPSVAARRRHGLPEGPSSSPISVMHADNLSARQFLQLTRERERGEKLHRQWQGTPEPTSRPGSETNRDVWLLEQASSRLADPLTSSPLFFTNRSNCYLAVRGKGPAEASFNKKG